MDYFLAERYLSALAAASILRGDAARVQAAARSLGALRLLQAVYVPNDETCFYLFQADSAALVERAGAEAGVALERIQQVDASWGLDA
jgi:hypothetical protein